MSNRPLAFMAAGFVLAFAAGCGGGTPGDGTPGSSDGPRPTRAPAEPPAAESCTTDAVADAEEAHMSGAHSWDPTEFTIPAGGSVTWINDTTAPHTVTFAGGPDCGYVLGGKSVSVTFDTPGVYSFKCRIYPEYMHGTVTVE